MTASFPLTEIDRTATVSSMPLAMSQRLVIDCPDPAELARFYGQLLGWEERVREDGQWAGVWSPDGSQSLRFQRVPDYRAPEWPGQDVPQQMHLDLHVEDLGRASADLLALDPSPTEAAHQPGRSFRVFLDPAGHPFCLTTTE